MNTFIRNLIIGILLVFNFSFSISQTLIVSGSEFLPQDSITFFFSSPSFNAKDWIGIYHTGETPGIPQASSWRYIPSASGELKLPSPGTSGTYIAYLFCCDGYDIIATSEEFSISTPSLTIPFPKVVQGDPIVFSYKSPKFSFKDRIVIYPENIKPGPLAEPLSQQYITSPYGTLEFPISLNPGKYDAYLLCCDGFDSITSCSFEVISEDIAFIIPTSDYFEDGSAIQFFYNDPDFGDGDWIAIFNENDDPASTPPITWSQLVSKSGSVSFPGVLSYGSYFAVLLCCTGTDVEYARSGLFLVEEKNTNVFVRTAASVYPEGTPILVNYRDPDYSETDWIGIYHYGEIPSGPDPLQMQYAPSDSGTIEFLPIMEQGDYVVYLFCCDGYSTRAKYNFKVVDSNSPSLVASKIAYHHGETIEFSYNDPNFNDKDWLGIYRPGDIPSTTRSIVWDYLPGDNGLMLFGVPYPFGTLPEEDVLKSLEPGEYWIGLFCCDAYGLYASTSFIVTEFGVGIKNYSDPGDQVDLFPNPTAGIINLKVQNRDRILEINIISTTGQVLYQEIINEWITEKTISPDLGKGIYIMSILTERSRISKKLVIQ